MRTKALLLAAAFAAVGVATSVAQVYSVNAVGYVNVNVDPGFNMVANPLDAGPTGNTIGNLFKNFQGTIPGGLKVYAFNNSSSTYTTATWDDLDNKYIPDESAAVVITPGNGVFIFNPNATGTPALKLTFVGEVPQGNLSNPLPKGFSIKASQVPQAAKPNEVGLTADGGDKIYTYNKANKTYNTYTYDDLDAKWIPDPGLPVIPVGEAYFLFRINSAGSWNRTFNVNNPAS